MRLMTMMFLLLWIILLADAKTITSKLRLSKFPKSPLVLRRNSIFTTKLHYNGSFTNNYDGLFDACKREHSNSKPCTVGSLIRNNFWTLNIAPSWILSVVYNCVGFSSHDQTTTGMCIWNQLTPNGNKQLIQCSCDMNISVCCHH